ncbi:sodium channel protein Nach-like [Aricia agestis]|uniref:sodium channel protein Nach-like n=1 Tax=Aricia agestis TaxID=91739 RepID=UPI001C206E70|nr:sodium channel protein Nach-like [Aricia agestis]
MWATAFTILFCFALVVQYSTVSRFLTNPTYIVQKSSELLQKPFPNVLIFPQVNFVEEKMERFLSEIKYPEPLNVSYARRVLRQLAAFLSPDVEYNSRDLENMQRLLDYNELDVETVGRRLTASCDEILLRCRWRRTIYNCSRLFSMEITRTGFCCVFNGRSLRREIKEHGIHRVKSDGSARLNVSEVGFANSLMIVVDQKQAAWSDIDLDYKWVALQSGQHYIDVGVNGTPINPGQELWLAYLTRTVQASDDALSLSTDLRKCHLSDEPLEYFPIYHESYCLLECEMRRTMKRCHCTKVAYPPVPGVPTCRAEQLQCAREVTVSSTQGECNCHSTCNTDIDFAIPRILAYSLGSSNYTIDGLYTGFDFNNVSIIRIYISSSNKLINQRCSYFTNYDLFAQIGGTLNLFFGCSLLTLIELGIMAHRWFKNRSKDKKRNKCSKHKKN